MEFDFQLAIGAIEPGVRGMVTNAVLVADVRRDIAEDPRQLTFEAGKVGAPPGEGCECLHLVIRLQVVHVADRYPHTVRRGASVRRPPFPFTPANADGIDAD